MKKETRMRLMVSSFTNYVHTYSGQSGFETYSDKTFIDDMLYGIGLALQTGTPTDYTGPGGYERFKERLREHLGSQPTVEAKP